MFSTILVIVNLFVLESMLSVDNAAVLAVMVKDLPGSQKNKALRYGLIGAYVFRGLCLFFAAWLSKIIFLKIVGGVYLIYLTEGHFAKKNDIIEETTDTNDSKIFRFAFKRMGLSQLWATIVLVEIMDLAFSIDNIFAAVALCNNFLFVFIGVAMGMLAMRFVAGWFVKLINKYPTLETSAFIVIGLLGLKLILSGGVDYIVWFPSLKALFATHTFDFFFSGVMMLIFFLPLLFNQGKKFERSVANVDDLGTEP